MARTCPNAKLVSGLITRAITGRGFASVAPRAVVSGAANKFGASGVAMVKKTGEEAAEKVSWVPDPRTGFFRPENAGKEIDAAELRNILLKKRQ